MNQRTRMSDATRSFSYERSAVPGAASNTLSIQRPPESTHTIPANRQRLLDRIVVRVAEARGISVSEIHSRSRQHELVVARAQIVWLAIESNLSTLGDVARYLHHSPSALTRAVAKYRRRYPHLFRPEAIGSAGHGLRESVMPRK
jgi:hypothetical protein